MLRAKCSQILQNLVVHPSVASPLGAAQVQWIHATRRGKNKKKRKQFAADVSFMETLDEYKKEKAEEAAKGEKEPHMLHVVWRNKNRLTGRPWWEKEIVEKLNLDVEPCQPVVLKNTSWVNERLSEIKHLVRIRPLTFPQGLPEHKSDFEHTYITMNGELIVKKRLNQYDQSVDDSVSDESKDKWRLTRETVQNQCDDVRRNYWIHSEYYDTEYKYKRNQDGKEYRYNFNKPKES